MIKLRKNKAKTSRNTVFGVNLQTGFSLVEIVVIIAILAVLLAILAPTLFTYTENSRMQKDFSTMDELSNAMQLSLTDANVFDEVYEYAVPNNYMTYTDSSGHYSQQLIDAEYWAPDGCANGVTITFNPENSYYDLSKGIVNDMTYGNGSVGEKRIAEGDLKQCYFEEMGKKLFYSSVKQSVGQTLKGSSATYRNSSYTVFIVFHVVDETRKVEISGAFNGTNLSKDCPAAIVENTTDYTLEEKPTTTRPASQGQSNFTASDLSGGGAVGGETSEKPLYKQCRHPSINQYNATYHICAIEDCKKKLEHEYPSTGLTAKCTVCGYIKDHECTFDSNDICTQCGEEKMVDFIIGQNNCYMAGITSLEGDIIIPKTFVYEGIKYKVTSLSDGAFSNCNKMTSVIIPDSVKEIGVYAFSACTNLVKISIPNSITRISQGFLSASTSVDNVIIPNSVTSIGQHAFHYCKGLTSITIPENVTTIENYAFQYCSSLKNVEILGHITSMGLYAFLECSQLTNLSIANGISSMGTHAFLNCVNLKTVNILDGETNLGNYAFYNCNSLTSVNIAKGKTTIGEYSFLNCNNLTDINLSNETTVLNRYAFCNCKSITNITIPNSVKNIKECVFYNCDALNSITFNGTKAQWNAIEKSSNWKNQVTSSCVIHCTDGDMPI